MTYSPSAPAAGITAQLIYVPDTENAPSGGCTAGDYAGINVQGKIALIERGACTFAIKTSTAKAQGAVGVISVCSDTLVPHILLIFLPLHSL